MKFIYFEIFFFKKKREKEGVDMYIFLVLLYIYIYIYIYIYYGQTKIYLKIGLIIVWAKIKCLALFQKVLQVVLLVNRNTNLVFPSRFRLIFYLRSTSPHIKMRHMSLVPHII
jgi:hypothetical protein